MDAPHKCESPGGTGLNANQNHSLNAANSATDPVSSKEVSAQITELALAGHHVHQGADGGFLVCKYGLSKSCADFTELQAFAVRLGVNRE